MKAYGEELAGFSLSVCLCVRKDSSPCFVPSFSFLLLGLCCGKGKAKAAPMRMPMPCGLMPFTSHTLYIHNV